MASTADYVLMPASSSSEDTVLVNDAAIAAAFALDYRPLKGESEQEAETLSAAALSGGTSGQGQGTVLGGGLRKLADYKTTYFDPITERERIRAIQAAQAAAQTGKLETEDANGPLTVIDWGPRGTFSAAVQRPSVYVMFSQPMVPLASLGEQTAVSPVVSINPPIKGSFRWYGTGFLSFEGDEPCQSQQVYTITVSPGATSIYGTRVSGETVFSFYTETLSLQSVNPGEDFKAAANFRFTDRDVPPEAAKQIGLTFNYPVQPEDIRQYLEISTAAGGRKNFTLTRTNSKARAQSVPSAPNPNKLFAELSDPVEFNTQVRITLKQGAKSAGGTRGTEADRTYTFSTPGIFKVDDFNRIPAYGKYRNMVQLNFSYPLNEGTLAQAIRTEPAMPLSPDNIDIWGSTVRIYNLPVGYGAKFKIHVSTAVEDVYGRKLSEPYTCDITVPNEPPPVGSASFLDYGQSILEAQFDPRFLFEYKNIAEGSSYSLAKTENPWGAVPNSNTVVDMVPGKINNRYFEEIDLKPFLNPQRKGFVSFRADLKLLSDRKNKSGAFEIDDRKNELNIQVTDLGLTVRYGFNKTTVLVTSLSTGAPVADATVKLLSPVRVDNKETADLAGLENFGRGITDKNGLAVINTAASVLRNNTAGRYGYAAPFVMAEKDGDRVIFSPSSHNNWAFGVNTTSPQYAEEVTALTFMFSDRGLYKPGETLTFRGVDRSKILGMYTIYQGDYTVALEEDRYQGEQVTSLSGTVTESGSFYGSLDVPDDLSPGSYRLVYRRTDGSRRTGGEDGYGYERGVLANIPITIAFFERLKFQASLSAPGAAVVSGDDISLTLRATYLSGGSLSGAAWESAWYRESSAFSPRGAETRGFVFGPRHSYESKRYIASESGMLSGDGTASLSQKTADGAAAKGMPYLYSVESHVTDISNQMVAAYRSVLVHPARFYIGLYRGSGGGFARAGQERSFDYITVDTAGVKTGDSSLYLQTGGEAGIMTAELVREEWRRVQQRGVNGYIYDQYVQEQVVDSTQRISLRSGGAIKIKPTKAGYYTLRLSARDRDGRAALTEHSFYVTGSGGGYWNMNDASELRLTPDQDIYNPGDTAQILLQSSLPAGYYLITVEREGIFTEEVRHFTESVSVIDVPIARNYVPVVYVAVSSYSVRSGPPTHEYGSPDLDKPKGYYGVVRLMVNPRARAFSVKVESDKKTYRPGDQVTMTLTAEQDGKPLSNAELTLMAVDRGVLDLINYHVPDPISYYYDPSRFPLAVEGGDSRAWLMDPVTYSVKNLAGGDGEGESKLEDRKDFNPTAVFEPYLLTDANGKVTCTFKLPDTLTTYRVTVFGVRGDIFALKESEIASQNKINVREVLPRRLRERDTAEAGVLITNLDSVSHKMTVKIDLGEPRQNSTATGKVKQTGIAFVDGTAERQITVKSGENAVVYFDIAAVKEGSIGVNFTVNSDILNERLVQELLIEHPYIRETVTTTGQVGRDDSSGTEGVVIPSFADNGVGNLSVTLDATRLSLLESAVQYLFHYPYGCMEQRSAAILPLVVFGEYLDDFNLRNDVANPVQVVEDELKSWAKVQLPNGGFPYWPSGLKADFYVSLRVAHIIAIAKTKGMNVPASFRLDQLRSYLNGTYQDMQKWRAGSQDYYYQSYLQSYMLYVFALLGESVDTSRLREILSRDNVDPSVLAFTGMTYQITGRTAEAASAAQRLRNLLRPTARGVDITDPMVKSRYSYYGGMVEQLALTLEFFAQQYPGDQINTRLLFSLLENKGAGGFWDSTAVTVRVLSAVDALIRAENLADTDVTGTVTIAGKDLLSAAFKGLAAKSQTKVFDFKDAPISGLGRDSMLPLAIKRQGTGSLYYTASLTYAIPAELQSFRDEGLGVFLSIYDVDTDEEVSGAALMSGKTYRVRVRVSSTRDRTYLALRVPIPSGAEILDAAFVTTAAYTDSNERDREAQAGSDGASGIGNNRSWISHQAILDNEIQYFWDSFNKGENTVSFLFRAVRHGVYPTPPVQAECMYESEIFGRSTGLIYTIE
ncbi:hypothetical protein AGMMS50268_17610 [Spirochaetia bacterium]|nr:hypothetical protein AGMMS50268_17610 [Spirochaetia bacterium]